MVAERVCTLVAVERQWLTAHVATTPVPEEDEASQPSEGSTSVPEEDEGQLMLQRCRCSSRPFKS